MSFAWQPAGDSAWVAAAPGGPATVDSAMMHALGLAVTAARLPGLQDVVPSTARLTAHIDPVRTSAADLDRLQRIEPLAADATVGRVVEIPIVYDGPDLDVVASLTGVRRAEVIERHASSMPTVLMMGFAPGFPYLGPVDASLRLPRRATPRVRVPAGAVGLAAGMTCIYPGGTGGGWHLIARSGLRLFDPAVVPPAALGFGDRVRWIPVDRLPPHHEAPRSRPSAASLAGLDAGAAGVTVLRPGQLTSVQDAGRWGFQAMGVPVSGVCDAGARRRANAAVGNANDAAVLEVTAVGPDLRFEQRAVVAWSGAAMDVELDGRDVPANTPVSVPAGGVLRCGGLHDGLRACIAVAGGIDVPVVLGSRSLCLSAGFGGGRGRPLLAGDRLAIGRQRGAAPHPSRTAASRPRSGRARAATLRVLPGADAALITEGATEALLARQFVVTPHVNRMGCRLSGAPEGLGAAAVERLPVGTVPGAVQVTPAGELLLLLADRQPTGGYPQVLSVIAADRDVSAQLCPGDTVTFSRCSRQDAVRALVDYETRILNG